MAAIQSSTQVAGHGRLAIEADGLGHVVSSPTHTVEPRLRASPAGDQIEIPLRTEVEVRDVQGPTGQEGPNVSVVGPALGLQLNRENPTVCPIAQEHAPIPGRGEVGTMAARHPRRTARIHLEHGGKRVRTVHRPLRAPAPPAVLCAGHQMEEPWGAVPGSPHVPFHVRVVGEELTVPIEVQVVWIAHPARHDLPLPTLEIGSQQNPGRNLDSVGVPPWIPDAFEHVVFRPADERRGRSTSLRQGGVVPVHHPEVPVGTEHQSVRTMLGAAPIGRQSFGDLVSVVSIEIAKTPQATVLIWLLRNVDVQVVPECEQPLGRADVLVQPLDARRSSGTIGDGDPEKRSRLGRDDQATVTVDRHRTP